MTIDTQKLRQAAASVRAFLNPEYGREIAAAADIIEALDQQVTEYARIAERTRAEAEARIEAQAAEIARLRDALAEIVAAADGDGWSQLDPSFEKARAALSGESNSGESNG